MTRKEKIELAIEQEFKYNPETGDITSRFGKKITRKTLGYITLQISDKDKGYNLMAHQLAWYITYGEVVEQIDHINGQKDDNRICNLRSVTNQENQWNRTKAKGYYWNKSANKWKAQIQVDGKKIYLGLFKKEEDARLVYLQAKITYHNIN